MTDFQDIIFERENGVARLTLNRPPLNVLTIAMMQEINTALESLREDVASKVLIVTGQGKAFSAGVDVADHTADRVEEMITVFHRIFRLLRRVEMPTVAVVNGAALGGGCELAIGCDVVIAAEHARIGQPEIQVGVFAPLAAVLFPRLMGPAKALELLLTGDAIRAPEAERIGLINKAVPADDLEAEVQGLIVKLTGLSGAVLRLSKRAVYAGLDLGFEEALAQVEDIYLNDLMQTEDAHEGLAAFMEKRPPEWRNR